VHKECPDCGKDISWRHAQAKRCCGCARKRNKILADKRAVARMNLPTGPMRRLAGVVISQYVRNGLLNPASDYICVDCGDRAAHWEHRDYTKPLDVEPACMSCNFKRGAGLIEPELPINSKFTRWKEQEKAESA
jgi:hypothetical protein